MNVSNYQDRVDAKIEEWNARIEQLKVSALDAGPQKRKEYEDEISTLIADREAARRGLLHLSDGDELCSSCPEESTVSTDALSENESLLEKLAPEPYDVARSPKTVYGQED